MKILTLTLCSFLLFCACSKSDSQSTETTSDSTTPVVEISSQAPLASEEVYSFDLNTLAPGCDNDSAIVCAINMSVKCTINPDFSECSSQRENMPGFVFMRDDSLQRPTSQSYKITKIKPLDNGTVEIYTQSTCNGNWFGLCNGNIIYVMSQKDGVWKVKDLYALES